MPRRMDEGQGDWRQRWACREMVAVKIRIRCYEEQGVV